MRRLYGPCAMSANKYNFDSKYMGYTGCTQPLQSIPQPYVTIFSMIDNSHAIGWTPSL